MRVGTGDDQRHVGAAAVGQALAVQVMVAQHLAVVAGEHDDGVSGQRLKQAADLVIVTAGHNNVDYAMVQKNAKAVFDTKNVMRKHNAFGDNVEVL